MYQGGIYTLGGGGTPGPQGPAGPAIMPWPRRPATPRVAGDVSGTGLTTLTLEAGRLYAVPLIVPQAVALTGLRLSVTTAAVGLAWLGIYATARVDGADQPGGLLAGAGPLDLATTGNKTGAIEIALAPGTLYWAALLANAAATLRALSASSLIPLARVANGASAVTGLTATGLTGPLPDTAPAMSDATGAQPAIYLIEA